MRILQLCSSLDPKVGGPPRVAVGAAVAQARLGHEVTIAAVDFSRNPAGIAAAWPALKDAGVKICLGPVSGPSVLGRSYELERLLGESLASFDILHAHGVWEMCLSRVAQRFSAAGKPYVVAPHGMLDRWSMARSRLKKTLALHLLGTHGYLTGASALLFGTADEASEAAVLKLGTPAAVVPNGIDPSFISRDMDAPKARLQALFPQTESWSRTILFYGRLHPKKGADLLIDAFLQQAGDHPDTGLLVAGIREDIAYEEALAARVYTSPFANRVILTTEHTGPESIFLLDAADLFVLPSHQEGFSIAILEAMARERPVLITDKCHFPEIADHGAGFVTTDTLDGVYRALSTALSANPATWREMGRRGRHLIEARFTWPKVAEQLIEVYEQIADRNRLTA